MADRHSHRALASSTRPPLASNALRSLCRMRSEAPRRTGDGVALLPLVRHLVSRGLGSSSFCGGDGHRCEALDLSLGHQYTD